jgi:hypothetical protein
LWETESLDRSTFSDYSLLSSNFSREKQKYDIFDGEIGYKKGESIISLTNYSAQCTGYVTKDNKVRVQENREDGLEDSGNEGEITQRYIITLLTLCTYR